MDIFNRLSQNNHFNLLYGTYGELIDFLVSYFDEGIKNNEYCMWILAESTTVASAKAAMENAGIDVEPYIQAGQLEIVPYAKLQSDSEKSDPSDFIKNLDDICNNAIKYGFSGVRILRNLSLSNRHVLNVFTDCERVLDELSHKNRIIALCAYNIEKCTHFEILDFVENSNRAIMKKDGEWTIVDNLHRDIVEPDFGRAKQSLELSHRFLEISKECHKKEVMLKEFVSEIQKFTDCEAIGIRLLDEDGNIPYQEYVGFSQQFYEMESPLSIKSDQCMCINVIRGDVDSTLPFYSEGGSFYMNGTTRFLATVSEEDKGSSCNVCNEAGYESVAVVPIHTKKKILGCIHLADHRDNMLPLHKVEMLENAAMQLATIFELLVVEVNLRESDKQSRNLFNSISDSIFIHDLSGKIIKVNQSARETLGFTRDEISQLTINDLISSECVVLLPHQLNKVQRYGNNTFETSLLKQNNTAFPVEITSRLIDFFGEPAILSIARDLTKRKQNEAEIRDTKNYLEAIIATSLDAICVTDSNGVFEFGNKAFFDIVNWPEDDIIGQQFMTIVSSDYHEFTLERWDEIQKGECEPYVTAIVTKNGTRKYAHVSISDMEIAGERKYCVIAKDITERKTAENMLRKNRDLLDAISVTQSFYIMESEPQALFNNLLDRLVQFTNSDYGFIGMVLHDSQGKPYLKNYAMTDIALDKASSKLRDKASGGMKFNNLNNLYGAVMSTGEPVISNAPSTDERAAGLPEGHPPLKSFLGIPFYHGDKMVGIAGLANMPDGYDETLIEYLHPLFTNYSSIIESFGNNHLRIQAEEELKQSHQMLEMRVSERTKELEDLNKELSETNARLLELDTMKSEFLSTVNHELRTPLTSIIGYSSLLLGGIHGDINKKQTQYIEAILNKGKHQLNIINDFLDLSKLESGRMPIKLEPVPITTIINDVINDEMPLLNSKQHELAVDVADDVDYICADKGRLRQILLNLLNNAIKFTPEKGNIIIKVGKADSAGDMVKISVIDNGIGIMEGDMDKLFKRFVQIDQTDSRNFEGTGLGLAIVKEMVELMGGTVDVVSEYGKGTTFNILFPKAQSQGNDLINHPEDYKHTMLRF